MHGTIPLLRTVTATAIHSTSRIPHLEFHILKRRLRSSRKPRLIQSTRPACHRSQSTFADVAEWRSLNESPEHISHNDQPPHTSISPRYIRAVADQRNEASDQEEKLDLPAIIDGGSPDLILLALLDENLGASFVRYASDELFDKALLQLAPEHFVEPYKKVYRHLLVHPEDAKDSNIMRVDERFETLALQLDRIIATRIESGAHLSLDACRHILKWAASLGNKDLAMYITTNVDTEEVWKSDVTAQNYNLNAIVWNHAYSQIERFRLRVLPRSLAFRRAIDPRPGYTGHQSFNPAEGINGIRNDALEIFRKLIENDLTADEFTFVNLMTAMGREADMTGVKSVLKSVWNIDVELLLTYDEDELESPTFYERDSPLRPSDRLLLAIVHIFCSNNDAVTAWTLIDYISRNYDLQIHHQAWQDLLEWYGVLSIQHSAGPWNIQKRAGRIASSVLPELFSVMVDKPHDIKPNGVMYYLMARSYAYRAILSEQLDYMRKLRTSVLEARSKVTEATFRLERFLIKFHPKTHHSLWSEKEFFQDRQDFILASLELEMLKRLMSHTLDRVFARDFRVSYNPTPEKFERILAPQIVEEFAEFGRNTIKYETTTGKVSIDFTDHQRDEHYLKYGTQEKIMVYMRGMLEAQDHEDLVKAVHSVRSNLWCSWCNNRDHYTVECPHGTPQISRQELEAREADIPEAVVTVTPFA